MDQPPARGADGPDAREPRTAGNFDLWRGLYPHGLLSGRPRPASDSAMCGICGAINLRGEPIPDLPARLEVMNDLIAHRGPDDAGTWAHERGHVGFGHRRLSIIDPSPAGHQPMRDEAGRWLTYNGEVYNYPELRAELGGSWRSGTDTEVVMRAHDRWGAEALGHLRGMFAYAVWDEAEQELLCVRDRFGIKPFYYAQVGDVLYFASEPKALLPFLPAIETDLEGLKDYLAFQFCLAGKTLFKGVRELLPGHFLRVRGGIAQPTSLLGGLLRPRLRPHREVLRGAHREPAGRVGGPAPALRRARGRLPQRRARLEHRGLAREPELERADEGLHGPLPGGWPLRRERLRARPRRVAGPRSARGRDRRRRLPRHDRGRRLPHGLSGGRTGIVPAVHGLPGREPRGQGHPRRPGRRRDLRRVHALPDRLLRAVHQGRHRRDHPRRQLRGHLRVDHPQPGRAAELQAADEGVLAGRAVRGPGRPLLPADQPRAAAERRGRPRRARRLLARSRRSRRSSTATTSVTSPTSTR